MKTKSLLLILFCFGLGISSTNAQVRPRAVNQHYRIRKGVQNDELTKTESHHLRKDQREVRHNTREAHADEKKEERKNNRKIYDKKHNLRERR